MERPILLLFLALLILNSACFHVEAKAGLGISHYGQVGIVCVDKEAQTLPVGRVYNTGTEELLIHCVWTQKAGNKTLPVVMFDPDFLLQAGESREVDVSVASVNRDYVGKYYDEVEVVGSLINPGPDVVPRSIYGGTLEVNIYVVENPASAILVLSKFTLSKQTFMSGETAYLWALARNVGGTPANFSFLLKLDDVVYNEKVLLISNREETNVTFALQLVSNGSHTVTLLGSWEGGEESKTETIHVVDNGYEEANKQFSWFWISILLAVEAVLVPVGIGVWRYKRRKVDHDET